MTAFQKVDVIIPNWNGLVHLQTCLASLRRQTCAGLAITVVDNGSTDDSIPYIREQYPEIAILPLPDNRGLTAAVNAGIAATDGELVILLNNDTEATPTWAESLVEAARRHPEFSFFASSMRLFDRRDVFHAAGDLMQKNGLAANRGLGETDRGQYDQPTEVFGACAGAALYRRSMLEDVAIGGRPFDADLFMYLEDVDLSWRAQLRGHRCLYVPGAVIYHKLSATGAGALAAYYTARNTPYVLTKNLPLAFLRRYWPHMAGALVARPAAAVPHIGQRATRARLRGMLAFLPLLPQALRKRRIVQSRTTSSLERIERLLVDPPR